MWAVVDGAGALRVNGRGGRGARAGRACALVEHERHTAGVLELEAGPGVEVYATCFTPGVA